MRHLGRAGAIICISDQRTRLHPEEMRIGYFDRLNIVAGDDHARAALCERPKTSGKVAGQTYATV